MDLVFKNQIIKYKKTDKIKYIQRRESGQRHYHIGVWIEGTEDDLKKISKVEYLLHPTFKKPLRSSENRENGFGITFWTYGWFLIEAKIYLLDGSHIEKKYSLEFSLPKFSDDAFVKVG